MAHEHNHEHHHEEGGIKESIIRIAVFADVGVTVLAVLNAMRALRG